MGSKILVGYLRESGWDVLSPNGTLSGHLEFLAPKRPCWVQRRGLEAETSVHCMTSIYAGDDASAAAAYSPSSS